EIVWSIVLLRGLVPAQWSLVPSSTWARLPSLPAFAEQLPDGAGGAASLVVALWLAGVMAFALFGGCTYRRRVAQLCGQSRAADAAWQQAARAAARLLGMHTVPCLRATRARGAPCVAGLLRPIVFVPGQLPGATDPASRENVLLHEFAHLQRRDPWRAAAGLFVLMLFWFHPIVWLASARLQLLRELSCDQRAAAANGVAAYRATLARCAAALLDGNSWLPAPGLGGRQLLPRLAALAALAAESRTGRRRRTLLGTVACLAVCIASCVLATPAPEATMPSVAELLRQPGCFARHYAVLTALAAAEPAR
ncbi:MAG TPA: M56 family metallopeptidase, partial [Planctomycetota bacterium]|nr:M56 family metallopeptidase [Planctomycetota bacterium]